MSENQVHDGSIINSIIGTGTKFKGEFELNGVLRIDGDFEGSIRTNGRVFIGSNGRASCTMHAGTVVVGGIVKGEIHSTEMVTILSTGMVIGSITAPRLVIEEGVVFNGNCRITENAAAEAEATDVREKHIIDVDPGSVPNTGSSRDTVEQHISTTSPIMTTPQ